MGGHGSKADQGLLAMGYDAMSQCPAMSADFVPQRCDAILIAGHTPMSDDAMQSDVAQAAMTSDVTLSMLRGNCPMSDLCRCAQTSPRP